MLFNIFNNTDSPGCSRCKDIEGERKVSVSRSSVIVMKLCTRREEKRIFAKGGLVEWYT